MKYNKCVNCFLLLQLIRVSSYPRLQNPGVWWRWHGWLGAAVLGQRGSGFGMSVSALRYPASGYGQRPGQGAQVGTWVHGRGRTPHHPQRRHRRRRNTTRQVSGHPVICQIIFESDTNKLIFRKKLSETNKPEKLTINKKLVNFST